MNQDELEELGKKWANDEVDIEAYELGDNSIKLNEGQKEFVNDKTRYCLYAGGLGSGKTLALMIKMVLMCLLFPGNVVLLGRKHRSDIKQTILDDLFDIMDENWYEYRVKDGRINFFNGSRIVLFGLDSLQSGGQKDINKAEQRIKSMNLGAYFIDQLEEVDKDVFNMLNTRLRRNVSGWRQGNMTCNPANFWAYPFFIENSDEKDRKVLKASMLDNEENLPDDYIEDQLNKSERHVERYVKGKWNQSILTDAAVFDSEYLDKWETQEPQEIKRGCKIYKYPEDNADYRMGIDPSQGQTDPSSVCVINEEGEEVARFNKKVPVHALGERVKYLYYKYNEPFIIPEVNPGGSGDALLIHIRDLDNIYQRTVRDERLERETKKLGFKTTRSSKPELITHFQDLLEQGYPQIHDRETKKEFSVFEWTDEAQKKGASAPPNHHDDNVIASLLSFWEFSPEEQKKKKIRKKRERLKGQKNQFIHQYR